METVSETVYSVLPDLTPVKSVGYGAIQVQIRPFTTGNSATSEIRNITSKIVDYALLTGKDIVIDDLDFRKTKSETDEAKSDYGKTYNHMIHAFDYLRYNKSLENCCFRRDVNLIKVNHA